MALENGARPTRAASETGDQTTARLIRRGKGVIRLTILRRRMRSTFRRQAPAWDEVPRAVAYFLNGRPDRGVDASESKQSTLKDATMFSRRNLLTASAMGAVMTVSATKAGTFGNPDEPPQGAIN